MLWKPTIAPSAQKKFIKVNQYRLLAWLASLCLIPLPSLASTQQPFLNILTGGTSGIYYPLGVGLSQIYAKAFPNTKISVQATKASAENLNLLQAGRGEIAFTLADSLSDAWRGNEESGFKTPLKKLRAIAGIYPNYIQIVANAESGIRTLDDLKGKRISVGAPKSGTELNARAILKAAGLAYKDFAKVEYLPFGESVELMKNRQLDVTLQSSGLGVASLRDLASSIKIVIIPIPPEVVSKVGDTAYQPGIIPPKTYEGQLNEIPSALVQNFLVTHENVSLDTVYSMTKAFFENLESLHSAHASAKNIDPKKVLQNLPIPLHPGAEKYYREIHLLK